MHPLGAATIWDGDFFRMTGVKRQEYLLDERAQLEAMGACQEHPRAKFHPRTQR